MHRNGSRQTRTGVACTQGERALMLVLLAAVILGAATGLGLFTSMAVTVTAV